MKSEYTTNQNEELCILWQKVQQDDIKAMDLFYQKTNGKMKQFARILKYKFRNVRYLEQTTALQNEAIVKILSNKNFTVNSYCEFFAYFKTILTSIILDLEKKNKSRGTDLISSLKSNDDNDDLFADIDNIQKTTDFDLHTCRVLEIFESEYPKQAQVFLLHNIEGMIFDEVAEKMSISEKTARNYYQQASNFIQYGIMEA
jgi:RNA polymerase sigma factor (sigma-70 family)